MRLSALILASLMVGSLTVAPDLDARGRTNNANANRPSASAPSSMPGNNNRPNNPGNKRPNNPGNNRPNNPGNNYRPNNPGNNNRPNNPGNNYRPNNPGGPGNHGYNRPNNPGTPPPPPQGNYHRPERPHFPPSYHYHRPTPPPSWRPSGRVPVLNAILGITFGSALNMSLNALMAGGYNVAGYGPSEIYLSNVNQFNYIWPDATMYYSNGQLVGSSFAYATIGYNMSRYNRLYNNFMGMYGAPVAVQNLSNGGVQATWWGYNNAYITLAYYPDYLPTGALRYYTTVSLGR